MKKRCAVIAVILLVLTSCASFTNQSPLLQQAEKLAVYVLVDYRIQGEIDDPAAQTAKMLAAHQAIDTTWTILTTGNVSAALLNSARDALSVELVKIGIPAVDAPELATLIVAAILQYLPHPPPVTTT